MYLTAFFLAASVLAAPAPWTPQAPAAPAIFDLVPDPTAPGVLWAAGDAGVLRSNDGGSTWSPRSSGLGRSARVESIAIDPTDGDQLWATVTGSAPLEPGQNGLYRSLDRGLSWRLVPEVGVAHDVAFGAGPTLYVASSRLSALWVSSDGGASWAIHPGSDEPVALAPSPHIPGLLVFTTRNQVFQSRDGGRTVTAVGSASDAEPVADPTVEGTFYLPADPPQVSRDGGLIWTSLNAPPFDLVESLALDATTPGRLFVATRTGRIARSETQGESWTEIGGTIDLQIENPDTPALLWVDDPGQLLFGVGGLFLPQGRLLRVDDDTHHELRVAGAGEFHDIEIDGEHIIASADDGIHLSEDAGATWRRVEPGLDESVPLDHSGPTQVARSADGTLWTLLSDRYNLTTSLLSSEDNGVSWARRDGDFVGALLQGPVPGQSPGVVRSLANFFLSPGSSGIWRSDDSGRSWEIELLADPGVVRGLVADPVDGDRLWAFTGDGVLHKPNADASWSALVGSPVLTLLAVGASNHLYGLGEDGLLSTSDDGGRRWRSTRFDGRVLRLAASPTSPRDAALVDSHGFVHVTHDAGRSWNRLPTDLAGFPRALAFGPEPLRLWLATSGAGLVSRQVGVEPLALQGARFLVDVDWRAFDGSTGTGRAALRTDDTGTFWFFGPDNLELMVKVLDGRPVNGHWWVYYGASTNVEFTLTVTDQVTGAQSIYFNPLGTFASFGDTTALEATAFEATTLETTTRETLASENQSSAREEKTGIAPGEPIPLLLLGDGRFRATVTWRDFDGGAGGGLGVPFTDDTGAFWFFSGDNLELMVKVLDGRPVNGHWWVFFGSLSNVAFTLEIEDLETGTVRRYDNPLGTFASVGDVEAF
ncbi:MAG: hypothetical protein AAGC60_20550 [Acidobacteriota bacterium]